jgi:membrane fusion protein (multidrug efflux system)
VDDQATFTVDAYPGRTFVGHVESLSPGTGSVFALLPPENATGNFTKIVQRLPVRIKVDGGADGEHPLRLGMSVVTSVTVQ